MIDLAIVLFIFCLTGFGYLRGASKSFIPFTLIFVVIALIFHWPTILASMKNQPRAEFLLLLLIFLFGLITFGIIIKIIRSAVISLNSIANIDKILGAGFGLIFASFLAGFFIWCLQMYGGKEWQRLIENSVLANQVLDLFLLMMQIISRVFPYSQPKTKPTWWKKPLF